jgi:hypothetical protein
MSVHSTQRGSSSWAFFKHCQKSLSRFDLFGFFPGRLISRDKLLDAADAYRSKEKNGGQQ